jgi:hypothetical protein
MSCPITKKEGVCPVGKTETEESNVKKITIVNEENQFEAKDEFAEPEFEDLTNLSPGEKEYRQLKRTMATIKKFYLDGTLAKKAQYDEAATQITKLGNDIQMCKDQMAALSTKPTYKSHLKQKEYTTLLDEDYAHLEKQNKERSEQAQEYKDLWTWSQEINKICEWLEANLEEYCVKNLELEVKEFQEPIVLSHDEKVVYSKGLDEIMNNLNESHDFFQASVDGRLLEFQYMEAEIIQAQLDVLKKYPEDNGRRSYFESILQKDLDYCQSRIQSGNDPVEEKKRAKVLKMHTEFLKLLRFFRFKWNLLNEEIGEKKYDPKFTQVYVVEDTNQ